jgi:FkbM family methyltransferase
MTNGPLFFGSKLLGQLADDVSLHLCDVGSRGGALEDFLPASSFTQVTGFEPDHEECERLNQVASQSPKTWKAEKHYQVALGDQNERIELIVCNDRFYSSTLEPVKQLPLEFGREQDFRVVDRLHMDVESLDSFCSKQGIADLDFLKVDVQGGELAILKGGAQMVSKHLLGIRCEVEFAHLYEGQPLFSEMEIHLRESGFYPADWLYERHWRNDPRYEHGQYCKSAEIPYSRGRLIHSDVLFLRDHHWIIANMDDADTKLCRLMLTALLYHHVDLALTILPLIKANKVVTGASREKWIREFELVSRTLSKLAFRQSAQDWFIKLRRFLRR